MKTYACTLIETSNGLQVPCGSSHYVVLDGRLSAARALDHAIEHFTKREPTAKHIAVFKAESLGSHGRVIATFPHGRESIYSKAVFDGCYK